jgi:hypothetical protein
LHSTFPRVLFARSNAAFVPFAGQLTALPPQPGWRLWTDDYSNLSQVLKSRKDD